MTFNFDYTLSWFNDYFATCKANRSRSNGFLPDVYQIWDEVIWLIPGKEHLIFTAPICWEQIEPSPEVSQQQPFIFMLSKSLIQLPVDRQGCLPSLLFGLRSNYGRGNGNNGKLLQKDLTPALLYSVPLTPW